MNAHRTTPHTRATSTAVRTDNTVHHDAGCALSLIESLSHNLTELTIGP